MINLSFGDQLYIFPDLLQESPVMQVTKKLNKCPKPTVVYACLRVFEQICGDLPILKTGCG